MLPGWRSCWHSGVGLVPPIPVPRIMAGISPQANEVTDSAYMGSESTYSECETFTDEDTGTLVHPELQPAGDADSAGGSAAPSECLDTTEETGHGALLLLPGRYVPRWGLPVGVSMRDALQNCIRLVCPQGSPQSPVPSTHQC